MDTSIVIPLSGSNDIIVVTMEKFTLGAIELGLPPNSRQIEQFSIYYQELVDWNKRVNLTTITNYEEVQIKHFLDSLTATIAWQLPINNAGFSIIDVGTGAGLPGMPLKIIFPNIRLVLLEATAKKAAFLHHLKQRLGLDNMEIVVGRAEEVAHMSEYRERFDIVLSRAVAPLATLVELTIPFSNIGGSTIAQKKGSVDQEINQATKAISTLGGSLREVKRIDMAEFTDERQLIIIDKVSVTPEKYPRRPGIPAKRPIM
ncbi:16S rRNA (guanine(527)-N(7))-methyltransferase RsmG [Chloroflexota bacterium]